MKIFLKTKCSLGNLIFWKKIKISLQSHVFLVKNDRNMFLFFQILTDIEPMFGRFIALIITISINLNKNYTSQLHGKLGTENIPFPSKR